MVTQSTDIDKYDQWHILQTSNSIDYLMQANSSKNNTAYATADLQMDAQAGV